MLAKSLVDDNFMFSWYLETFKENNDDFKQVADQVFNWYQFNTQELKSLPSGFKLDLLNTRSDSITAVRLKHSNTGSIYFESEEKGQVHIGNEEDYMLRLGLI